jgi:hypothetical protein
MNNFIEWALNFSGGTELHILKRKKIKTIRFHYEYGCGLSTINLHC